MATYVALLRGINVSGANKIRMESLKTTFENLGFRAVTTYIQSGNVVFDADGSPDDLSLRAHRAISAAYGYDVEVIVKTREELEAVRSGNPFLQRSEVDLKKLHVTFLAGDPADLSSIEAPSGGSGKDEYVITGREIYLHCPDGYGRSKIANGFWERKLALPATTRNWNSIGKLCEIASSRP